MPSIRKTKKEIRYTCGDLASELLIAAHLVNGFNTKLTSEIIGDIASLQVDALDKCTFSFDKVKADFENVRAYRVARGKYIAAAFQKLTEQFAADMQKIIDKMNAAMPKAEEE